METHNTGNLLQGSIDPDAARDEWNARRSDPECCELCGGWLADEPRYEKGRAHLACVQQEWADWYADERGTS